MEAFLLQIKQHSTTLSSSLKPAALRDSTPPKGINFHDWKRRLNEKALDTFGLHDIVSDENTKDDSLNSMLLNVSETARHFQHKKDLLSSHSLAVRAFHESCRSLSTDDLAASILRNSTASSSSDLSLLAGRVSSPEYPPPPPMCPPLAAFGGNHNVSKAFDHVLMEHCVCLCNQALELCDMMGQKAKRRENMILDYSHHKRLFERIEAHESSKPEDEEFMRRKEKLIVATTILKEATSELTDVLMNFFSLIPSVRSHMSDSIVA